MIPLIYVKGLEIKETTETASSASFLDIYLQFTAMVNFLPDPIAKETTSILPLSIFHTLEVIYQLFPVWSLYFTTHTYVGASGMYSDF